MSDEEYFHTNGFVNKQHLRHWETENLQLMQEKSYHTQRVNVWCAIMHDRIIGSYFFENEEGVTETVNGERYRNILNIFPAPVADHMDNRNELWFQQDGATCHTSNASLQLLH